ncbi:MAG: FAD-dependent oxidoreductase [Candidatus Woesearchaeota archaeon]
MKLVIVGFGSGGFFAAMTAMKLQKEIEIIFVDKKEFDLLHCCGLPFSIEGTIKDIESLKHNFDSLPFKRFRAHECTKITPAEKTIEAVNIRTSEKIQLKYDKLLLDLGSYAFIPPIEGVQKMMQRGIFCVETCEDVQKIREFIPRSKKAVVVGAGAIGLETAFALKNAGLDVLIVESLPYPLFKSLDQDIASILQEHLNAKSIKSFFSASVEKVEGEDKVNAVFIKGQRLECDMLIMATGVRANTKLAADAGISIGKYGIVVNEKMETSIPDIYAIGDCVQVKSLIDQRDYSMQLAVAAYKQGVVAAYNMCGMEKHYMGALGTFVSKIGDIEVACTGFNSAAWPDPISGKASGTTRPEWCLGKDEVTVKIIIDKTSKRVVGAQAIGHGAAERINVVSAAIQAKFTVYDLAQTELAYCPAISDTHDILMRAADNAIRKIGG